MPEKNPADDSRVIRKNSLLAPENMQRLKVALELAASAVVVAGVPLFFIQQHAEEGRARVERTINFSLQLQGGDLSAARINLTEPWTSYDLSKLKDSVISKAASEKIVRDVSATHPGVKISLMRLIEFYDGVDLCVSSRACDERTAQQLFGPYAAQLVALYSPVIEDLKVGMQNDSFAHGLLVFSRSGASILQIHASDG